MVKTNCYVEIYRLLVDTLREFRRNRAEQERFLLELITDFADHMSEEELSIIMDEGWLGWPDLYNARMAKPIEGCIETADPDDPSKPPRAYIDPDIEEQKAIASRERPRGL